MSDLRILTVTPDTAEDWRFVHNQIIPADALSADEVAERLTRYHLEVAYAGEALVGCTTVRPPADGGPATVIVRVLAEYRHRGYGRALYAHALLSVAPGEEIETVVWEPSTEGLEFAYANGFVVEIDRYVPEGEETAYLTLRRG
ncbi:GNAT family N-acetyltransferase [Hamadaea tsunoensis]|uniref:GNAT family N-acetyltransferase n=1 Tax=Hamadaea tsunoensis TaxID=53368 RepID=UPI00041B3E9D|nr:GNAT family N-acetyltransferase [Hamadaea tsunoensis]